MIAKGTTGSAVKGRKFARYLSLQSRSLRAQLAARGNRGAPRSLHAERAAEHWTGSGGVYTSIHRMISARLCRALSSPVRIYEDKDDYVSDHVNEVWLQHSARDALQES